MLKKVILAIKKLDENMRREEEELKVRLAKEGIETEEIRGKESGGEKIGGGEDAAVCITDQPERMRARLGEKCCLVLYLTEESRKLPMEGLPYAVESLEGLDGASLEEILCRHLGLPCRILETARLCVREAAEADLDSLYQIYAHPDMTAYMDGPDPDREKERKKLCAYIQTAYRLYGFGVWMLEKKETGMCIGRAGFFWRDGAGQPELGFAVKKEEQRKGYCLEACRAILDYGFHRLGFGTIQAVTIQGNSPSEAVLSKLGFRRREKMRVGNREGTLWILDGKVV